MKRRQIFKEYVAVSACLAGMNCRYDGKNKLDSYIKKLVKEKKAVPICPEELGGLKGLRPPSEIVGGDGNDVLLGRAKVLNKEGENVTDFFVKGAYKAFEIIEKKGIKKAILKEKSPSCGVNKVYDGTFSGKLKSGSGVTAALLKERGIEVLPR